MKNNKSSGPVSNQIVHYVEKIGGIEKVRELLAMFRALDKNNPEVVRQFVARISTEAHMSRALCSAALLGLTLSDYVWEAVQREDAVPFVAFGPDLGDPVAAGDMVLCAECGEEHELRYTCPHSGKTYLAAVDGQRVGEGSRRLQ